MYSKGSIEDKGDTVRYQPDMEEDAPLLAELLKLGYA